MMNQTLLSLYAVMVLLSPVNILSYFTDETTNTEANGEIEDLNEADKAMNHLVENLWTLYTIDNNENDEKAVTTLETSRAAAAAPEISPEEEQRLAFEEWLNDLPVYEEDTPQGEFIQTIAPAAVLIADAHGIYPSVMLAQASLESSWGQSGLAQEYNNLMGTKGSWNGESITVRTREDINGESVYINAGFSVYDSWADSLYRYGLLMADGLEWDSDYYSGVWRENTDSYKDATAWLQGRYATDSSYAAKLNATIESFNLDQYDEIEPFEMEVELDDVIELIEE